MLLNRQLSLLRGQTDQFPLPRALVHDSVDPFRRGSSLCALLLNVVERLFFVF